MKLNLPFVARAAIALAIAAPSVLGLAIRDPEAYTANKDSFYDPPAGFESEDPGAVLRSRRIATSYLKYTVDPVDAYQVLFRTTAINGSAISGVTTIFKPARAKRDRFVSYHVAYDSSASVCSPSYAYHLGNDPSTAFGTTTEAESLVIQLYLLSGYIVSSPDYEGPEAAFAAGHLSAMVVLDSMRAVSNFGRTLSLTENPSIVGVGYSGGGLATAWAAAIHPLYAPELPIKGWSAGGVPANLTATFEYIDGTIVSGFQPIAIAGMLKPSAYGAELQPLFDSIATPVGRQAIDLADTKCALPNIVAFRFQSVLDTTFQSLGRGLLSNPTVASLLVRNTLGVQKSETPMAPLMMYHASADEIVPYGPAAVLMKSWCSQGATIKFTNFAAGGHGTTAILALSDSLKFVRDAFDDSISRGCTARVAYNETLNPWSLGLNLEVIAVRLINWLGAIGKQDNDWLRDIERN